MFATNNGSHPVFRGVALMRRVACLPVPDPGALGIVVSFPATDATQDHARPLRCSTRATPSCARLPQDRSTRSASRFEGYDGMGQARTTENGKPIDSSVTVAVGSDFDGTYADSNALATALAASPSVRTCLARQLFRSTAGRSDSSVAGSENAFVELWKQLPADQQGKLVDVLVAFVRSPLFVQRRTP